MKMKLSRKLVFLPLLLACFPLTASTQDKSSPEVYSAVAIGTGGSVGAKTMNFDVRITSYTTDDEVQKFAELLKAKGQDALVSALQDENKGRVLPVGSTGNQIAVARKRTADGVTTITIITTRLMSFRELYNNGRSTDYPFGFIQFKLNSKGEGTGQIMASAIATEYSRADYLPAPEAAKVRSLLLSYLDQRLLFYRTRSDHQLEQINATLAQLDTDLWTTIHGPAAANPTQIAALVVSGANDVSNARGFTEAAWLNRIPNAAWLLMFGIAVSCNLLLGYGLKLTGARGPILLIIPLVVAICFCLIADIDSPRGGVVRVNPYSLEGVSRSLRGQ